MNRDIYGTLKGVVFAALVALATGACTSGSRSGSDEASRVQTSQPAAAADTQSALGSAEPTSAAQHHLPPPGKAWVIFGKDTVRAEVARTEAQREKGLMYRDSVPAGTGMLFVFDQMGPQSFWMEHTYVDLDIAFMDASYRVVDIQQMKKHTTSPHQSAAPAMFALEVPEGWFEAHGIHVGSVPKVEFGPELMG